MNHFNDYVYHFLQPIQVKMINFNDYVCDLLQLIDIFACQQSWHTIWRKLHIEIHPKSPKFL